MTTLHLRKSIGRSPLRLGCVLIPLALTYFAFSPAAKAQNPTPAIGVVAYHSVTNEDNANTYGADFYIIGVYHGPYPVGALTIHYHMGGTAVNGTDYVAVSGTVVYTVNGGAGVYLSTFISAGGKHATLTVDPGSDYGVYPGYGSATITIRPPTITVDPYSPFVDEGATDYYDTNLSFPLPDALPIHYAMTGTAINGTDYTMLSGSTAIPAHFLGSSVELDTLARSGGKVATFTLLPGSGYRVGDPASADITIVGSATPSPTPTPGGGGRSPTPTATPTASPACVVPAVTTSVATSIASNSATLSGTVNPNGCNTTVHLQYGTTSNYGSVTAIQDYNGNTTQYVTGNISGLSASTTYHFRIVAHNGGGTSFGSDRTFTTLSVTGPPVVTTNLATLIASFSATLNGSVDPHGMATNVYFQYGTTTGYGLTTAIQSKTGNTYQNVAANISGLTASTTYHFRIVATNSVGTRFGSDRTFTTLTTTGAPVVTTNPPTNVASSSATLNSSVDPHGLSTSVYFQYGTTTSYGHTTTTQSQTGNTYRNITANISGLTTHTAYHFRIVATNTAGTRFGSDRTFTTP